MIGAPFWILLVFGLAAFGGAPPDFQKRAWFFGCLHTCMMFWLAVVVVPIVLEAPMEDQRLLFPLLNSILLASWCSVDSLRGDRDLVSPTDLRCVLLFHSCELMIGFWVAHGRVGVSIVDAGCVARLRFG